MLYKKNDMNQTPDQVILVPTSGCDEERRPKMAGDRNCRAPNAKAEISNGINQNAAPTKRHAYCML